MSPGLNIAALSRRTGIAPDTLRKWEQRYRILQPSRTSGGQRRYTESDVARVEWLRARLSEGYRISEAAALLGPSAGPTSRTPAEFRLGILAAVDENDPARLGLLLDQAFALHRLQVVLNEVLIPVLHHVGDAWQRGEFSVAQEHLLSESVRSRLGRLLADARGDVRGVAVLACAPGERHELGLLMLALLLRTDGWQVAYLGADMPPASAVALAARLSASVVGFSATLDASMRELERALATVNRPAGLRLVLGGAAATPLVVKRLGAERPGEDLPKAASALRAFAG